jgi:hypothetical protein
MPAKIAFSLCMICKRHWEREETLANDDIEKLWFFDPHHNVAIPLPRVIITKSIHVQ